MFRQATQKDIPQLIGLIKQLGYCIDAATLQQNITLYGAAAFVIESNGAVIGFLAYHILPQFHSSESHMRIVSVVVDAQHRNQGIGKKLLAEAERIALQEGCTVIELTSAAHRIAGGTHAFYKGQGYVSDGRKVYFRKEVI
ncbi:MAG: GNAT family N-acetyltransferase [Verrucomicrobia bacterium]|nr:GNAT family N-acetyltransferase [Verrucomicrobiota bacterium]MBU6446181.1 GNAT family N-acetyltransferase [Verrucomicrobiota bacterium]MDE3046926.1 GNAT family N-acetyltransferase [Verrucomicrobiota bacterium]